MYAPFLGFAYISIFVAISVVAFLICAIVPRLRGHTYQALIAPLAFGVCGISAVLGVALSYVLFIHIPGLGPFFQLIVESHVTVFAMIVATIYLITGTIGSWIAVWTTGLLDSLLIQTDGARRIIFRLVTAVVSLAPGFVLATYALHLPFKKFLFSGGGWTTLAFLSCAAILDIALAACVYLCVRHFQTRIPAASLP